ncbi:MAG: NADH-quinone oxidoreductase subunit C [Dehalococcoidia bacterium]|nr:NADH-quinone oxidoreductase subunit C [Dehalococcoidia bacterium]
MTVSLSGTEVAKQIASQFPEAIAESSNQAVVVKTEYLLKVAEFLKNSPDFDFNYLNDMTAADYYDYFEVVFQLSSLNLNHKLMLKTRCYERLKPAVPSVCCLWRGAELMEREIYDLMGITFTGHPNLKRIVLWEGFQGHPLRKDYL